MTNEQHWSPIGRAATVRDYLRVSKDSSGRGKSPTQQHDDNRAAALRQGWLMHPGSYVDNDRSASRYRRLERPDFDKLLEDLASGSFGADVLGLWEPSRGSRDVEEWARLIRLCEQAGVWIWVTTHGRAYDPSNARDRRTLLEDAVDSAFESDKTRDRILRYVAAAAKEGRPHGKNLYGYRRVYDPQTRELVRIEEHPEQAPIYKEAAERLLGGDTFYAVAKSLNERDVPPRRPKRKEKHKHDGWTAVAVKQMLTVPAYAGKRVHNGEIVSDAIWPALIDYEKWQTLQSVISPAHRKRNNEWGYKHLLSGIAVCGICGAAVRLGKQNVGRRKEKVVDPDGTVRMVPLPKPVDEHGNELPYPFYYSYQCKGTPGKDGFHVSMKEEFLDQIVREHAIARLARPDVLSLLGSAPSKTRARREELRAEIAEHQRYLEDVRERAAAEGMLDLLFDQQKRIEPRIRAAQKELERLVGADPVVLTLVGRAAALSTSASKEERFDAVAEAWEELSLTQQRKVIAAIMTPVISRVQRGPGTGRKQGLREAMKRFEPGFHGGT